MPLSRVSHSFYLGFFSCHVDTACRPFCGSITLQSVAMTESSAAVNIWVFIARLWAFAPLLDVFFLCAPCFSAGDPLFIA